MLRVKKKQRNLYLRLIWDMNSWERKLHYSVVIYASSRFQIYMPSFIINYVFISDFNHTDSFAFYFILFLPLFVPTLTFSCLPQPSSAGVIAKKGKKNEWNKMQIEEMIKKKWRKKFTQKRMCHHIFIYSLFWLASASVRTSLEHVKMIKINFLSNNYRIGMNENGTNWSDIYIELTLEDVNQTMFLTLCENGKRGSGSGRNISKYPSEKDKCKDIECHSSNQQMSNGAEVTKY